MKCLVQTHSSNPDCNDDCDFCVIDLTPELAKRILARQELANKLQKDDAEANEVTFRDYSGVNFYAWSEAFDEIVTQYSPHDVWVCDNKDFGEPINTEYEKMIIDCPFDEKRGPTFGVRWMASRRHSDIDITTDEIPLALVRQVAEGVCCSR